MNACIGKLLRIDIRKNILANIFLRFNKKKEKTHCFQSLQKKDMRNEKNINPECLTT